MERRLLAVGMLCLAGCAGAPETNHAAEPSTAVATTGKPTPLTAPRPPKPAGVSFVFAAGNASPQDLEHLTEELEGELRVVEGVKSIASRTRIGTFAVSVTTSPDADPAAALEDAARAFAERHPELERIR